MMSYRRYVLGALIATLAVPMMGCAQAPRGEQMSVSIEQAKTQLWAVESELLAYVPAAAVTRRWPHIESSLLVACAQRGSYFWPGAVEVGIDPDTDTRTIIAGIFTAWSGRPGWTPTWVDQGAGGQYHLKLARDDGLQFSVMNLEGNTLLRISSFTGCIAVPDVDPNRKY